MTAPHPAVTTVVRCRRSKGRWLITLSCGHKVRVDFTMPKQAVGKVFPCPGRPIGVVINR